MNISDNLVFQNERPSTLQVSNTANQHIIAIGLKKGQVLKKHSSATPATLIVLKGNILYQMEGCSTEIAELATFDIPAKILHEVTGLEESIFLIIKEKVKQTD